MKNTLILLILTTLLSCKQQPEILQDYYYPLAELKEGKVYEYQPVSNEKLPPIYWYFQSEEKEGTTYLNGEYYDYDYTLKQITREKMTANTMEATAYRLLDRDSTGLQVETEAKIQAAAIYPRGQKNHKIYRFKIEWQDALNPNMTNTLIRGRFYTKDTTYTLNGQEIPCAAFRMVENIEVDLKGEGVQKLETTTQELFAKGIGLIYYKKTIGDNNEIEYQLAKRHTPQEFEKMIGM